MEKLKNNTLLGFILGAIIFGSLGVVIADYALKASQVEYEAEDGTKTNMQDAVDTLYTVANQCVSNNQNNDTCSCDNTCISDVSLTKKSVAISFIKPSNITSVTCVYGTTESYGKTGTVEGNYCVLDDINASETYYYKITGYVGSTDDFIIEGNTKKNFKDWTITYDANNNGIADYGDMITFDKESFYVISNDGTTIRALAAVFLTEQYKQKEQTGDTALKASFGSDWTWRGYPADVYTSALNVSTYIEQYKTNLNNLGANITLAELLNISDLTLFGFDIYSTTSLASTTAPEWVYKDKFDNAPICWITAVSAAEQRVYKISYTNKKYTLVKQSTSSSDIYPIRPVIEMPASNLQ